MRKGAKWIGLAGMAVGTAAVVWLGAGRIFHAIVHIGWLGLGYVIAWQLAMFLLQGVAWQLVCPGVSSLTMSWARLVREGGVTCLPFSGLGGLAFGARALMLGGVDFARATASTVVDVVAEGIALVPFLLFGLIFLLSRAPGSSLALSMGLGLGVVTVGGTAAILLRRKLTRLLRRATEVLLRRWVRDAPRRAEELEREIDGLFGRHARFGGSVVAHVLCWCGGAGNVWIGYHLLGAHPSAIEAIAIESIFSGVLSAGYLVPGGYGVQELTYVAIGRLFGIAPPLSLALSLIRRARDLLIGAPALLAWQAIEAGRLKRRPAALRG